jgi:hypothetical protein
MPPLRARSRFVQSILLSVVCCLPPAVAAGSVGAAANDPAAFLATARGRAEAALARADFADYRGWIKFLRFEAETAAARSGVTSEAALANARRLDEWVARITADPHVLATLRGVQEWAYESPADGSGQPFKIVIPTDYDPARPAPLSVYMHGLGGNHLDHSSGMTAHPGPFEIAVLGRSRAGGYRALSEADVLHVIDYVQAHWAIDPDRIHLNGGSMGGGGTYRLGARYPHRWASGRPTCGYASYQPPGNLLTFPVYATHSADDWVVSVLHARGPLARLRELGGQAILDETTGLGHASWDYAEGNQRGDAWVAPKVRPVSRTVRRIDFTALDGGAVRGWWGEVVEWGPLPKPARFQLTAGVNNALFAELANITRLRLRLAESPSDRAQPLQIAVNGAVPLTMPAPLPESVVLARGEKGWSFESAPEPAPFRLHTPGGSALLYNGEPLLIVYGTQGSGAERAAMRTAAEAASKSPNPAWLDDSSRADASGIPTGHNLYGRLLTKADIDVTDADIARCHLVLIGTALQNIVVARLADHLPVRCADGAITCSDGVSFPGKDQVLGLVHCNPVAPDRLVFWAASDNPAAYTACAPISLLLSGASNGSDGIFMTANPVGADFIILGASDSALVAVRTFDSRWRWTPGRDTSPLLPALIRTPRDFSTAVGLAIRRATGTDFAFAGRWGPAAHAAITAGSVRLSDVTALYYYDPIGVLEMSGSELLEAARRLTAPEDPAETQLSLEPGADAKNIAPARTYRVALPIDLIGTFCRVAKMAPRGYRHTDLLVGEALERFLAAE